MDAVQQFEAACQALEHPSTHSQAAAYLEGLRSSPGSSVALARAVLTRSPSCSLASQMHATMLLRTCVLVAWSQLSAGEAPGIRDWLLSTACSCPSPPLATQLILACAVLWKRGWCEEGEGVHAALFAQLAALAAASPAGLSTAVRLACALVQEFGAAGSGKATALGLPAEWHAAAAASFQAASGLRPAMLLALRPLLDPAAGAAADLGTLQASAEALLAFTSWDFAGSASSSSASSASSSATATTSSSSGGGSSRRGGGRLCPGAAWRDLLADARSTVAGATLALHGKARAGGREGDALACTTRAVLLDLCGMEGSVFCSAPAEAAAAAAGGGAPADGSALRHAVTLISGCLPMLAEAAGGSRVDALQRVSSGGSSSSSSSSSSSIDTGQWEEAYTEGAELHSGLASLVSVHGLGYLAGGSEEAVSALVSHSAGWIGRVLMGLAEAAQAAAAAAAAAGSSSSSSSGSGIGEELRERSEAAWAAIDTSLELWVELCEQCRGEKAAALGLAATGTASSPSQPPIPPSIQALVKGACAALYDAVLRARAATAVALLLCGQDDDDNPYEDTSALENHFLATAALGRHNPRHSAAALCGHLGAANAANGGSSGGGGPPVWEQLWWLSHYATALLTDPGYGEQPEVPRAINAMCSEVAREGRAAAIAAAMGGAGAGSSSSGAPPPPPSPTDPAIQLSSLLLAALQTECAALAASSSSSSSSSSPTARSPILLAALLTSSERWARTYLMPVISSHGAPPLSLALSKAYGVGASSEAAAAAATPVRLPEAPLSTLTAVAAAVEGAGGGRGLLEFLLQAAGLCTACLAAAGEPAALAAATSLLHRLCTLSNTAPHVARTPAAAALAAYGPCVAMGAGAAQQGALAAAAAAAAAGAGTAASGWVQALPRLAALPVESAGAFVKAMLALTRSLGAELPAYDTARKLPLNDMAALGPAAAAAAAGGAGGLAIVAAIPCDPAIAAVLGRWAAYSHPYIAALAQRAGALAAALGSSSSSSAATGSSSSSTTISAPQLQEAATGLLAVASAVLGADPDLPSAWVLPGLLPALSACTGIVRATGGRGPCTTAALTFVRDFLRADLELPSAALAEHVQGTVGGVFECFGAGQAAGAWAAGTAAAAAAAAAASARAGSGYTSGETGELWEVLLLLLDILQCLCDSECISFSGGTPSSDTLLKGLSLLLPLLSPPLLAFPRVSAAYMAVAAHIVSQHPTHTARLSPPLFAALIQSLLAGLGHYDPEVAEQALSAIKGLGMFHVAARERGGAYGAMDLTQQLSSAPELFHTLARAVLSLGLGGAGAAAAAGGASTGAAAAAAPAPAKGLHSSLVIPAAEALLACICAEPGAFQGAAEALLGQHAGSHGSALAGRLAAGLTALTSVHVEDRRPGAPAGARVQAALTLKDRHVRHAFAANFQAFVTSMAGALTIL